MKLNLVKTSDFVFRTKLFRVYDMELPFVEHLEELRQRIFQMGVIFLTMILVVFINVKTIVELLEKPVTMIKFIQLSPGEYLVSTIKIAVYVGLLICVPIILSQIICFIFPGLTLNEKKFILPIIGISFTLFILSVMFSYSILIPAALKFFIQYSENVIEPLWSFDQYLDFTLLVFYSTSLAFQIPIFQLLIGLTGLLSGKKNVNTLEICGIRFHNTRSNTNTVNRSDNATLPIPRYFCFIFNGFINLIYLSKHCFMIILER
jgi:sec-independent protein translocase protein TatC